MDMCPWRRKWQPTPVLSPGKSHGQRNLVGYSPWGPKELDRATFTFTTSPCPKRLHNFTFLLVLYEFPTFPHPHQYLLFPIKTYKFSWIWIERYYVKWISQTEKDKHLYVESKKYNKLVNKANKKQTHRYREQTRGHQWGAGRERQYKDGVGRTHSCVYYRLQGCLFNVGNIFNILQ